MINRGIDPWSLFSWTLSTLSEVIIIGLQNSRLRCRNAEYPPSLNMVNAEFTNAPLGTTVALITILALLIKPAIKIANRIFTYKKGHSEILKKGGVPAFMLNFFIISIPLKKLPTIGKPEKVITFVFFIILLLASWFLIPALVQTLRTPPDSTLLIWKESGKPFYISAKKASEATTFLPSSWSVTVEECRQNTLMT